LLLATIGLLHPFENPAAVQDGCAVNCTTSAPATAQANAPVDFTATSATTGCTIGPTFRWEFGDGTSSTQQSPQHSFLKAGTYHWRMTVNAGSGNLQTTINTIAGGGGDGNPATRASFAKLLAIARDPGGRGFYLAETPNSSDATSGSLIRFVNTSNASVTLAGLAIAPGSVRTLAGGGTQTGEGAPGLLTDLTTVTGLATSANGDLLYYIDALTPRVRALNVSNAPALVRGVLVAPGSIETLSASSLFGLELNGLAVGPDGSVYVADATFDINRVYRIAADGTTAAAVGNGAPTNDGDPFQPSTALNYPLLQPRDLTFDGNGNLFVADAGHARVIRVAPNGAVTLAVQLLQSRGGPYPGGIAVSNGHLYVADGTSQVIVRGNGSGVVAGQESVACEYGAHPSCGDGGPVADATFGMVGRIGAIPLNGIEGDANGIYLIDQTLFDRSRVRFSISAGAR
jgi:PKD repeat protein